MKFKPRTLLIAGLFIILTLIYYFIYRNDAFFIGAAMLIMVLWLQLSGGWKPKRRQKKSKNKK
ncbi:MAG TPA: hypothetical protein VLM88_09180 [Proteiniclasticum sp.]|nr:hypothetical protein [Proteiniclasticum sp.]